MKKCNTNLLSTLSNTTPLKYITTSGLNYLSTVCTVQHLSKHDKLYTVKDTLNKSAFVLCNGSINITDAGGNFIALVNHSFTLFDESFIIFDEERHRNAVAKSESTVITLPAFAIEYLLEDANEMRFSQALGTRLRLAQGISSSLSGFEFALRAALLSGSVDIRKIIPAFISLSPAIHRGATLAELDVTAWSYAVNRLPRFINEVDSDELAEFFHFFSFCVHVCVCVYVVMLTYIYVCVFEYVSALSDTTHHKSFH